MVSLSIIIPHYNAVEQLKKLLDEIPNISDIQIIVIDDNSNQDLNKLEKIKADYPYVEFYCNEKGENSAGTCRNIGLKHANGQWLLFADSDDYFLPGFYDKIKKWFDTEADIIYFVPTSISLQDGLPSNRHEAYESLVRNYLEKKNVYNEIRLRYYQEGPISKLIRRNLVERENILFDEIRVANDVMFSIKCAFAAGLIEASEENIYCITKGNKGSLTAEKKKENFYTRLNVFIDKYKFLKQRLSKEEWKQIDLLGSHYIKMAKAYSLKNKEVFGVYWCLVKNGVRIYISRNSTYKEILRKILNRIGD